MFLVCLYELDTSLPHVIGQQEIKLCCPWWETNTEQLQGRRVWALQGEHHEGDSPRRYQITEGNRHVL